MSDNESDWWWGVFTGIAGTVLVVMSALIIQDPPTPSTYCPAILEHAPDTLAVVQEFPACIKYTEGRVVVTAATTVPAVHDSVWTWGCVWSHDSLPPNQQGYALLPPPCYPMSDTITEVP